MRKFITCLGDALIDFLPITENEGETVGFRLHPAGSLLNVAVGLARLEQQTAFAGKIAPDFFGHILHNYMLKEKVSTRFLSTAEAHIQTTLAFVTSENGEPGFAFYGDHTADTLLDTANLPQAFFNETAILHFGSTTLVRGTTPATSLAAAERLKGQALISLDPNIRSNIVQDETTYRDLLANCFKVADIVKLSKVDLEWLEPTLTPEQFTAQVLAGGASLVVVTKGGAGVLATTPQLQINVPAFPIQNLVDTVGAGDAFCSGLLAALTNAGISSRQQLQTLSEVQLRQILRYAAVTAAITCTRPGSNPPYKNEVEQVLSQ